MSTHTLSTSTLTDEDLESPKIPFWRLIFDQGVVTSRIKNHKYAGSGTEEDPFVVTWIPDDPRNPLGIRNGPRWAITSLASMATFAIALGSSVYSGGIEQVMQTFNTSEEVATVGISLWVLGFALGPLVWAPLSEVYGRRYITIASALGLAVFTAGSAGAQNIETLIILRFFAGSLGSAPMAVSGSIIADIFPPVTRGLGSNIYAVAAFIGPALGPVIGGYLATSGGWRWNQGFLSAFAGALLITITIFLPETYAPVLLHKRAKRLSEMTGRVYKSQGDLHHTQGALTQKLTTAFSRPFILLVHEPIVLLLSLYSAIIYGILYLMFSAYPFVYQKVRGWSEGQGGLAFLGILVGIVCSIAHSVPVFFSYRKKASQTPGRLPPEERLPSTFPGALALPIGLIWFAWTNDPSIHWMASVAAGVPFGFGMVTVYMPIISYLMDAYTIYAASVIAVNAFMRSLFGCVFPLFTNYMYAGIGIHWASMIPAFLALACVPMPFLFYKYGAQIRLKCRYAAEADAYMNKILGERKRELESKAEAVGEKK